MIMKKLLRILPIFAFILGITMAFASQNDVVATTKKALNSANQWVDITGQVEGPNGHYVCDEEEERICTQLFDEMDNPIVGTEVEGRYRPLNP